MDYGCDISNRYTGYLDSSDHGISMSTSSTHKNRRRTKKKRKSNKHHQLDDNSNNHKPNMESVTIEFGTTTEQQSFSNESKYDTTIEKEHISTETDTDFPKIGISYGSPMQSSRDEEQQFNVDEQLYDAASHDVNINETKWSVICFEEEKSMMALESQFNDETLKLISEPELVFTEHRVYPTIYFYNSNFGNKNCRTIDWHDSYPRSKHAINYRRPYKQAENRRYVNNKHNYDDDKSHFYNEPDDHPSIVNENENTNRNIGGEGRKKKPRRKKNTTETDNSINHYISAETHSNVEKLVVNSHKEPNEVASLQDTTTTTNNNNNTNEQTNNESIRREIYNSKNRYNKFKHGMPQRTFTRRRTDFVRNV